MTASRERPDFACAGNQRFQIDSSYSGRKHLYSTAGFTAALLAAAMLTGCGTTSSLEAPPEARVIDLTPHARLLVQDFSDEATARAKPEVQPLLKRRLDAVVQVFPDQIASATARRRGHL